MRRYGSRHSFVLVPQELPDYHEGGSPIASGIHVALRKTRGNVPAYPVVDSVSCDGGVGAWLVPTFSASRSAPFSKRATTCLGSDQLCSRTGADGLLCQSLQCQSAQPLRVALALFRARRVVAVS
jgi:hypothetical protein